MDRRGILSVAAMSWLVASTFAPARPAQAAEVLAPASWAGAWQFTLTYRDSDTGQVMAVDQTAADICPGEPLGLSLFSALSACETTSTDAALGLRCASELVVADCSVQASLRLDLQLSGQTLSGSGEWIAAGAAACAPGVNLQGQTIDISAVRRSAEPRGCTRPSTLVQTLVTHPALVASAVVPFASLAVEKLDAEADEFEVKGTFALGRRSDGIDPTRQRVTLQVGSFRVTIPAGSFRLKAARAKKPAEFVFEGRAGQARLDVKISRLADARFAFRAEGQHAGVGREAGPMPLTLRIGNDGSVVAVRPSHGEDGEAGEHNAAGRRDE